MDRKHSQTALLKKVNSNSDRLADSRFEHHNGRGVDNREGYDSDLERDGSLSDSRDDDK